jgi:hypothetical protein
VVPIARLIRDITLALSRGLLDARKEDWRAFKQPADPEPWPTNVLSYQVHLEAP